METISYDLKDLGLLVLSGAVCCFVAALQSVQTKQLRWTIGWSSGGGVLVAIAFWQQIIRWLPHIGRGGSGAAGSAFEVAVVDETITSIAGATAIILWAMRRFFLHQKDHYVHYISDWMNAASAAVALFVIAGPALLGPEFAEWSKSFAPSRVIAMLYLATLAIDKIVTSLRRSMSGNGPTT